MGDALLRRIDVVFAPHAVVGRETDGAGVDVDKAGAQDFGGLFGQAVLGIR